MFQIGRVWWNWLDGGGTESGGLMSYVKDWKLGGHSHSALLSFFADPGGQLLGGEGKQSTRRRFQTLYTRRAHEMKQIPTICRCRGVGDLLNARIHRATAGTSIDPTRHGGDVEHRRKHVSPVPFAWDRSRSSYCKRVAGYRYQWCGCVRGKCGSRGKRGWRLRRLASKRGGVPV